MKLDINNFAKISEANIIIDGITIIAGENNTGKSTVGKILFSIFNSLSNVDKKIFEERFNEIESTNIAIIQNNIADTGIRRITVSRAAWSIARRINLNLMEKIDSDSIIIEDFLWDIVEKTIDSWWKANVDEIQHDWSDVVREICKNTLEVLNLPEDVIVLEIISRYFNDVFHSQIKPLAKEDKIETKLVLDIKGKKQKMTFENNYCKYFVDPVKIVHKAVYIDNPFVIDELSKYGYAGDNPMNQVLIDLLTSKNKDGVLEGVIESVRAKEKLSDIYEILQSVVDGEIFFNKSNEEYFLKNTDSNEPISFHNLSTGIKSFVILKMLLEKGSLKEKDVLILDEPEIHLHPQWQVTYAELIVLLQKYFDLSVIVTTHSPYFVDAINLFSCKYDTDKSVNYYLASNTGDSVTMECVTKKIDLIYKKMASPIQMLDTLRYELNNN